MASRRSPIFHPLAGLLSAAGHAGRQATSGDGRLLIRGDIVHKRAVRFPRPQVAVEFDIGKKQALANRKKWFARGAKEELMVTGMHPPFAGIGHGRAAGSRYAWVPVEFAPIRE